MAAIVQEHEQMADSIEELEDKLNKAIDALEKVQAFVRDLEPHADQGHTLVPALREACEILAELKQGVKGRDE
jgi:cell division septum initiation protein DivIVA